MAKVELKRLTIPGVLMRIEREHLVRFFDRFKEELRAKNFTFPTAEPGSEGYCNVWAESLKHPELLPEALVEAVQAMEEQITRENWPRLGW
jgi:hypothetical protein